MFSPSKEKWMPAARARSRRRKPSGVICEKYPRRAMFSELILAIRQRSASQTKGGRPLSIRTWFVFSKARRSMTLASPKEGEAGDSEVVDQSAGVVTLRGPEYATVVTNRATGRDPTFCAEAV